MLHILTHVSIATGDPVKAGEVEMRTSSTWAARGSLRGSGRSVSAGSKRMRFTNDGWV